MRGFDSHMSGSPSIACKHTCCNITVCADCQLACLTAANTRIQYIPWWLVAECATISCAHSAILGQQVAIQKPGTSNRKQYKYDKVFGPDSNQEQVYEDTKALIRSVLDGV